MYMSVRSKCVQIVSLNLYKEIYIAVPETCTCVWEFGIFCFTGNHRLQSRNVPQTGLFFKFY